MIKVFKFLGQVGILVLLFGTLWYFDSRSKRQDYNSLQKHAKPTIGTFQSRGRLSSIFWTFTDGVRSGRVSQRLDFEGSVMGEQYHAIYDSTDFSTGKLDLLRPYLQNKVVDTTYDVEVLNFPLKANASSISFQYLVNGERYARDLWIRQDEASARYRIGTRWMVVYVVDKPKMGYLYPLE
jgi:hypothetical protein